MSCGQPSPGDSPLGARNSLRESAETPNRNIFEGDKKRPVHEDELKRIERAAKVAKRCTVLPLGAAERLYYVKSTAISVVTWGWIGKVPPVT